METGDRTYALGGNAPYVVDGLDGSLHRVFPWMCEGFQWADQYREKVRGEVPPRALDVEIGRLVELGRRAEALKAVCVAGDFGPVNAQRYVDAVAAGAEPDPGLLARLLRDRRRCSGHPQWAEPGARGLARRLW